MERGIKRMKMIKVICHIIIISIICGLFTGCYDSREVDDLAYVLAIGLDTGKTNTLKMTIQIAIPGAIGGGGGGGGGGSEGGGGKDSFLITTIETPTIYSGLNMINTYISRQVNLSHTKAFVFSKELAEKGMGSYLHVIARSREMRPNLYIVVSRTSAEDYIKSVKPKLELSPAKYYELIFQGYKHTSFIANSQFHNFYNYSESSFRNPVAILAGVNKFDSADGFNTDQSTYKEKGRSKPLEGDFKAGDVTRVSDEKAEVMGLAVFDGDEMVGELDGEEATSHLICTGEYKFAYWTIPDPMMKDKFVLLNIKESRDPQYSVEMVDGKPKIDLKVKLEADILVIQSTIDYEQGEKTKLLEKATENFIKEGLLRYLNKTAKEFHSDICGFGEKMKSRFLSQPEWVAFQWKSRYKDSTFNVDVDLKIRRTGLLIRSEASISSKGKGFVEP
jgi:spore germination protein KC